MRRLILVVLIVLVILSACKTEPKVDEFTQEEQNALSLEIGSRMDELFADAEALKIQALQKYLSDNPEHTFYMGSIEYGKQTLLDEVQKEYALYKSQKIQVTSSKVIPLSPEAVLAKYLVASKAIDQNDYESETVLSDTWLWQKIDGQWVVTHFDESWQELGTI